MVRRNQVSGDGLASNSLLLALVSRRFVSEDSNGSICLS